MLRLLIGLLLMSFISLQSASWQEPLRVSIEFVDLPKKIIRFPAHDLQVGEFGFVVTKLSDYEIINSEVVIIAVENSVATAKFRAFESMKQSHLPTPRMVAKKGDLVYFRQFNNQAFLIAPNDELYEQIRATNTDINFISSDLLVTFLNGFDPKIANLRKACNVYSVGVIYIVTTNTLNILSCESFEILEKRELDTSGVTKTSTPFFSRVEGIDAGTLGKLFSGNQSKNYFAYYDALVKKEKRKEVRIDARENKREIKQEAIKEPKKANQGAENAPTLEEKNYQKAERKLDAKEERRRSRDERKKTKATKKAMEFEEREKEHDERDEKETEERRKALEMDKGNEKVNARENEQEINQESANEPSSENNTTLKDTENTSVLKESAAKKEASKPSSKEEKRRLKEEKKKAKAEQRAKEFEQRAREHQERDEKELEERRKALEMNKK
ncbi:plasminogen-binding N-terminal domain-containing protein [Helicobacter pylori]|uniref:plasminogen-binding protein PgbA n=1 Tax=Helicobacter pylori TaxID=210 RepID=UPI0018D06849|nr:plasminogen-binding N-terminal domain-containing protein [Helicobacter pylori]MBH0286250.1 plasminogen-binding N-terminal domain-containing protein [Helicobacter pylori]MBH0298146.1 plasminogen-binding N-terminal domain-containing protein [Helicobacter pylori]